MVRGGVEWSGVDGALVSGLESGVGTGGNRADRTDRSYRTYRRDGGRLRIPGVFDAILRRYFAEESGAHGALVGSSSPKMILIPHGNLGVISRGGRFE